MKGCEWDGLTQDTTAPIFAVVCDRLVRREGDRLVGW